MCPALIWAKIGHVQRCHCLFTRSIDLHCFHASFAFICLFKVLQPCHFSISVRSVLKFLLHRLIHIVNHVCHHSLPALYLLMISGTCNYHSVRRRRPLLALISKHVCSLSNNDRSVCILLLSWILLPLNKGFQLAFCHVQCCYNNLTVPTSHGTRHCLTRFSLRLDCDVCMQCSLTSRASAFIIILNARDNIVIALAGGFIKRLEHCRKSLLLQLQPFHRT